VPAGRGPEIWPGPDLAFCFMIRAGFLTVVLPHLAGHPVCL